MVMRSLLSKLILMPATSTYVVFYMLRHFYFGLFVSIFLMFLWCLNFISRNAIAYASLLFTIN